MGESIDERTQALMREEVQNITFICLKKLERTLPKMSTRQRTEFTAIMAETMLQMCETLFASLRTALEDK